MTTERRLSPQSEYPIPDERFSRRRLLSALVAATVIGVTGEYAPHGPSQTTVEKPEPHTWVHTVQEDEVGVEGLKGIIAGHYSAASELEIENIMRSNFINVTASQEVRDEYDVWLGDELEITDPIDGVATPEVDFIKR